MSVELRGSMGFTLIELIITLAILVVLLTVAAPSMRRLVHSNMVRTEASRLVAAINLTRSEAVLRNRPVSMCPSSMAATGRPLCSGTYADGWIIYSNRNRDR
ncbi:MAG: GspH/FimT family pseudopilin, partial [Halioglobus sp.]